VATFEPRLLTSRIADNAIYLANCVRTKPICARLSRRRVQYGNRHNCAREIQRRSRAHQAKSKLSTSPSTVYKARCIDGALFSFSVSITVDETCTPASLRGLELGLLGRRSCVRTIRRHDPPRVHRSIRQNRSLKETPRRTDDRTTKENAGGSREDGEGSFYDQAGSGAYFLLLTTRYGRNGTSRAITFLAVRRFNQRRYLPDVASLIESIGDSLCISAQHRAASLASTKRIGDFL